jgi:hypothetical protein
VLISRENPAWSRIGIGIANIGLSHRVAGRRLIAVMVPYLKEMLNSFSNLNLF